MATYSSWTVSGASIDYVPIENPVNETVKLFNGKEQGSVPPTTNLSSNTGQYILAQDGTWIPQPSFTSGGSDAFEILRPSVLTPTYSAYTPTVTNSANAYDVDTNHATTFGEWECAFVSRNLPITDTLLFTSFGSKTQTWTSATINISRAYGYFNDGESNSSSKVTSVKVEFSTNGGSSWTTIVTDLSTAVPLTATTSSYTFTTTPTMGNVQVKLTLVRGGGGMIYDPEIGISVPGSTGDIDLRLYDIWISGTYSGGSGNITCNNLTVTGDATFQNKIYDSTASAGTTGQVLKVAANGKVTWATDSAGTGTVTSITTTGANGVTISGGSTQTITTSGTFALALGNITPTSISTGTGSFSGDVEFAASIKSPNGSNSPIVISPDGTGDLHVNADSLRLGDNNADATIATNGTGDLILTTHEGSVTQGIIRLYDGANGNITLTPNGTGQVQVGSDQVVTLIASQTLTNKTLSSNSVWNGNVIGSAYGGAGTVNGILKANGSGTVSAASAGTDYVTSVSVTSPVSNTGTTANPTIALASGYGDTQNPYGSKTANYFLAAPNGSAGVPTFRAIVAADIPTLNQSTTGNAATASALQTARNINGVSFNGTADITVTAAANTLTGTTLASGVTASSLTSVGTLGTLTVSGATALATSSGSVGIGTASPAFKLHTYIASGTSMFKFESGANTGIYGYWTRPNQSYIQALNLDNNGDKDFSLYDATNGQVADRYYPSSTGYRAFFTNGSERMRIDSNGNVGIGTSTVVANFGGYKTLELNGTTGGLLSLDSNGTNNLQMYTNGSTVNVVTIGALPLTFGTNSTERMRIDSSGNVGLGTTSPTARITVNGNNTGSAIDFTNTTSSTGRSYRWVSINSGGFAVEDMSASGAERLRIDSSGNLGIGTSSPSGRLHVSTSTNSGHIYLSGASQNAIQFRTSANGNGFIVGRSIGSGDGNDFFIYDHASSATRLLIDSSGNVGIGTASPTNKLQVNGVMVGNNAAGSYTKGFGGILTTTSTSTPTGGSSGDFALIY